MAIEIVSFPIYSMVIFHGKMLVYQRVYGYIYYPMDPSTFLGSLWGIIYYDLEA